MDNRSSILMDNDDVQRELDTIKATIQSFAERAEAAEGGRLTRFMKYSIALEQMILALAAATVPAYAKGGGADAYEDFVGPLQDVYVNSSDTAVYNDREGYVHIDEQRRCREIVAARLAEQS